MREHMNTLYVTTPGVGLFKQEECIVAKADGKKITTIPIHHLHAVFCMEDVWVSPHLMHHLSSKGISVAFFGYNGRFLSRVIGPVKGNVHLRVSQIEYKGIELAKMFVLGKIINSRTFLLRRYRESMIEDIKSTTNRLQVYIEDVKSCSSIDVLRGIEGRASREYFDVLWVNSLIDNTFCWKGRSKRPPMDPLNAVLSFLYTLIRFDCMSALESVGLDPQIGFLHSIRSGRPALALDLMEEFRAFWGDRVVMALVNRKQLQDKHFDKQISGAVLLNDLGRKIVIKEYQQRKSQEIEHPFLKEKIQVSLLPLLQAKILARYLRGDLETYPPFIFR